MKKSKKVLFIMSGSIACYKAAQVISRLVQQGVHVQVVASNSALQFIGQATLEGLSGQKVVTELFESGHAMDHIHLIREADLVLMAPATANTINKLSQGLGDDLITTLFLAHDFKKPFLIAPAMNTSMYNHPVTQKSLQQLKKMGVQVLDSASGVLACGELGYGKLLDPDLILKITLELLLKQPAAKEVSAKKKSLLPKNSRPLKLLVTAGGTQEKIDSVRRISNISSGQTGFEIAKLFHGLGCQVQLLLSENSTVLEQAKILFPNLILFSDHQSLDAEIKKQLLAHFDGFIHTAAVSDYQVHSVLNHKGQQIAKRKRGSDFEDKISSDLDTLTLKLQKTSKIINQIKMRSKNKEIFLVGFKLTTNLSEAESLSKIQALIKAANCDLVVHNDITEWSSKNRSYRIDSKKSFLNNLSRQGMYNQLAQSIFSYFNHEGNLL
jgi:phosphopantothenoylcysteine decarboxylase/phosphopantothenate--cysteine ligase